MTGQDMIDLGDDRIGAANSIRQLCEDGTERQDQREERREHVIGDHATRFRVQSLVNLPYRRNPQPAAVSTSFSTR